MATADQKRSLTQDGMTGTHALLILLACAMVFVGIYLTNHFFDAYFPTSLSQGTACNLSSYFNCDVATFSKLGHFSGVPLSFFGALVGGVLLLGSLFPSANMESTNKLIAFINGALCLLLLLYSLLFLKGLCPICMIYWLTSLAVFFLFYKYSNAPLIPSPKILVLYLLPLVLGGFFLHQHFYEQLDKQQRSGASLVDQFFSLPNLGEPKEDSPYKLAQATPQFKDAPLRLSIFSDFQCPACKMLSEVIPAVIKRYEGKINVQYFFFPLDSACNHNTQRSVHPLACHAARIAACAKDKFPQVHDDIFKEQDNFSAKTLNDLALRYQVQDCVDRAETKDQVAKSVRAGDAFQVNATPTMILNGVKIETVLYPQQFYAIFDGILKRGK